MTKRMEQSPGHDLDPGHGRVSVVTLRNAAAQPPAGAVAAAPSPVLDADHDVGRAAAERGAAPEHASQAGLTQSIGQRLTRDGHDAQLPAWRPSLTKPFSR
jgi:hypothetical protein